MAATGGPLCRKWSPQFFSVLHGTSGIAIAIARTRAIEAS